MWKKASEGDSDGDRILGTYYSEIRSVLFICSTIPFHIGWYGVALDLLILAI